VSKEIKQLCLQARDELGVPIKLLVAQAIQHYWRDLQLQAQSEAQGEANQ
jgi:hypothetical protein